MFADQHPRVLIFDSGFGGLSVFAEVRRRLPRVACICVADTAFGPYGTKPGASLIGRLPALLAGLAQRYRPDLAVIACNTASTIVLPAVRAALAVPVVGTVPAIKPAAETSRSGTIGLLGTPATVARAYTERLIEDFAPGCTVVRHGSAELVTMAEAKLRHGRASPGDLRAEIAPLFAGPDGARIDTVVLACTHFPLLQPELASAVPRAVDFVDSGAAIARRVEALLESRPAASGTPRHTAVVTAAPRLDEVRLAPFGIDAVEVFAAAPAAAATPA